MLKAILSPELKRKATKTFVRLEIPLSLVFLYICFKIDGSGFRYPEVVHHRGSVGPSVLWDYYTTGNVQVVSIEWNTNNFISPSFTLRTQGLHQYVKTPNPHEPKW